MRIKNTSESPRGIYTVNGLVVLEPGESRDLDIPENALEGSSGWFEVDKPAKAKEPDEKPEAKAKN